VENGGITDRGRASDFFHCLEEFERRLNGYSRHFPEKRQSKHLVKTFSDNIFVAFPLRSHHEMEDEQVIALFLSELVHQVHELTLYAGFPMRGAVTVGPLMFTEKFLFGPALVEAVALEKAAQFPRILLSPSVLKFVRKNGLYDPLVMSDVDGTSFLDYLNRGPLYKPGLELHKSFVLKGLTENKGKVRERQKYEWLAQYHNFHAQKHGLLDLAVDFSKDGSFSPA
jgi:hypothetical protein